MAPSPFPREGVIFLHFLLSLPDAPSAISVKVTTLDHHSLALSWESVDESDELVTPVTGYIISYKSHLDNWEELKMVGKRTSYVLENLRCGTKYQVTVVAYNKAGRSKPSELASAATAGNGQYFVNLYFFCPFFPFLHYDFTRRVFILLHLFSLVI